MKKTITLILTSLITMTMIFTMGVKCWPSAFGFVLFRANDYVVFNEHRKPIGAYLFEKKQTSSNDPTFELIVYLPSESKYRYLTIVPAHKLIGLAEQADKKIWVLPGAEVAYMFPGGAFFTPLDGPYFDLISTHHFSKEIIWFNTFHDLKKLGNRIVIQHYPTD